VKRVEDRGLWFGGLDFMFKRFEDIESWKMARELTKGIYTVTNKSPFDKDWGLKDQIRRASISIISNIAEGFERNSKSAFMNYLSIAKASAGEVRAQLYAAVDQEYINEEEFSRLSSMAIDTGKLIGGLMTSMKKE
jgi:four helix bundle protein